MSKLHLVLREIVRMLKNATRQLAEAYQTSAILFADQQAYFTPYQHAFEVIGLAMEMEKDYFKHAAIPENVPEDITPLQAASVLMKMFNQESFFMLHEYSLQAFSQLPEIIKIAQEKYAQLPQEKKSISFSHIDSKLGSVNWVTRFQLFHKELQEIMAAISSTEETQEFIEVVEFVRKFAETTMQYLDTVQAFQKSVVEGKTSGDSAHPINQLIFNINSKKADLERCEKSFVDLAESTAKITSSKLGGIFAFLFTQDMHLLPQKISILQDEIKLLETELKGEHEKILKELSEHRQALKDLQTDAKKLDVEIREKMHDKSSEEKSSTLAWKRAIRANKVEYLEQLFKLGLDGQMVSYYLFQNSNSNATITANDITPEMNMVIQQYSPMIAQQSEVNIISSGDEQRVKKSSKQKMNVPNNSFVTNSFRPVEGDLAEALSEYAEKYAEEYCGEEYEYYYYYQGEDGEEHYYAGEYTEEYAEEYVEEKQSKDSDASNKRATIKTLPKETVESEEQRVKGNSGKVYSGQTIKQANINVFGLAAKFGGFKPSSTSKSDEPSYSPKPSK